MSDAARNASSDDRWFSAPGRDGGAPAHQPTWWVSPVQDECAPLVAEVALLKTIAHAVRRLQARYPTAPSTLVQDCVEDAFDHLRSARVKLYLPILIERSAGRAVAEAIRSGNADR